MAGINEIPKAKARPKGGQTPFDGTADLKPEGILSILAGYLGLDTAPRQSTMEMKRIPTQEYTDYAMDELGYDQWGPHSEYLQGKRDVNVSNLDLAGLKDGSRATMLIQKMSALQAPSKKQTDYLARSYLVATELPISELGYDASRTYFNDVKPQYTVAGQYDPSLDVMSITSGEGLDQSSDSTIWDRSEVLPHEAIHRGLELLSKDDPTFDLSGDYGEALTRWMLKEKLGPEYVSNNMDHMPPGVAYEFQKLEDRPLKSKKRMDEINEAANKKLGQQYDEWAGAMD